MMMYMAGTYNWGVLFLIIVVIFHRIQPSVFRFETAFRLSVYSMALCIRVSKRLTHFLTRYISFGKSLAFLRSVFQVISTWVSLWLRRSFDRGWKRRSLRIVIALKSEELNSLLLAFEILELSCLALWAMRKTRYLWSLIEKSLWFVILWFHSG